MVKFVRKNSTPYIGRYEIFTLMENAEEVEHIPMITEVVSYLTGGWKRDLSDKYDWVKVNPFYNPIK